MVSSTLGYIGCVLAVSLVITGSLRSHVFPAPDEHWKTSFQGCGRTLKEKPTMSESGTESDVGSEGGRANALLAVLNIIDKCVRHRAKLFLSA